MQDSISTRSCPEQLGRLLDGKILSSFKDCLLEISAKTYYSNSNQSRTLSPTDLSIIKLSIICFSAFILYSKYLNFSLFNISDLSAVEIASPANTSKQTDNQVLSSTEGSVAQQGGLVQFISGVIAVYIPEATDSGKVAKEIIRISNEENVDPLYIAAVISVESGFSPKAKSNVGATGLMQLMPVTAQYLSKKLNKTSTPPKLTDTKTNIHLGVIYLKVLNKRFKGNKKNVLAAYNMGPTKLRRIQTNEGDIPEEVEKYADKIINRTRLWNKHFETAKKYASLEASHRS